MDSSLKKKLRALSLALRHTLEGSPDQAGDLESRLNQMGVWKDRPSKPVEELRLSVPDLRARRIVDAFLNYRQDAGISQREAFAEFVRESAYTWANRFFMLRCLESRGLIDEVVLQKQVYGGRSLVHHRFAQQNPSACAGEDDGLFFVLEEEFRGRATELPTVFDPQAPAVTLRPSVSALKRCIALLSGIASLNGQGEATDELFEAGDAPGWAYQFWNAEEKDRVFEKVRTEKGAKIEGADLIPATQLYTEPYMVKFLVQNSLGALWAGMYPETKLPASWEYYVRDADRTPPFLPDPPLFEPSKAPTPSPDPWVRPNPKLCAETEIVAYARTLAAKVLGAEAGGFIDLRNELLDAAAKPPLRALPALNQEICKAWDREWPARRPKLKKPAAEFTFLDPACGSGHFLLEAFDLLYAMYEEEGILATPEEICTAILSNNLFGLDIDERAIQISVAALWMHALERAPKLQPEAVTGLGDHIIAANLSLPRDRAHLEGFLAKHPEDAELRRALEAVFRGLADANQLGTLLRVEEPVEQELRRRKEEDDQRTKTAIRQSQTKLEFMPEQYGLAVAETRDYDVWKHDVLGRLKEHFRQEAAIADPVQGFFGREAEQGIVLFEILAQRFDVVAANPPYLGQGKCGPTIDRCLSGYVGGADLYAAFIERSLELTADHGIVGILSLSSYLSTDDYEELRAFLLEKCQIQVLVNLSNKTFESLSNPNAVFFSLATFAKSGHSGATIRTYDLQGTDFEQKKEMLLDCLSATPSQPERASFCHQSAFLMLPGKPIAFNLPHWAQKAYEGGRFVKDVADARQGLITGENDRFLRFRWEALPSERWIRYAKGGTFRRWAGNDEWVVDWQYNGARVRNFTDSEGSVRSRPQNTQYFFRDGCSWSSNSVSAFGVRQLEHDSAFDAGGSSAFPQDGRATTESLMAVFNTPAFGQLFSAIQPGINYREGYLQNLPYPPAVAELDFFPLVRRCVSLQQARQHFELTSEQFSIDWNAEVEASDLSALCSAWLLQQVELDVELHDLECQIWDGVERAFEVPEESRTTRRRYGNRAVGGTHRIEQVLEALSRARSQPAAAPWRATQNNVEEALVAAGCHPADVRPSLTAQLKRSLPESLSAELAVLAKNLVSMIVLRLLGHTWSSSKPGHLQGSATDGIIPLTETRSDGTLLNRVVDRLRTMFSQRGNDFEQITGTPLSRWLGREWFQHHVSQFRNRPIAWLLQTRPSGRNVPCVFAGLLHYHRISGALPTLRTQHVGPLRISFESELRTLESPSQLTSEQSGRRGKLSFWIEELKQFQETLEGIEARGFATATLRQYAITDAIHSLSRRWLGHLREKLRNGPVPAWREKAKNEELHADFSSWVATAVEHVDRQCVFVAPDLPTSDVADEELTAATLSELFRGRAVSMIRTALEAICREWQSQFDKTLLQPLREQVKAADEEHKQLEDNIEHKLRRKDLKSKVKALKSEIAALTTKSQALADHICDWSCPEAEEWIEWLATQPLYDEFTSLDGRRPVPKTVAEFGSQESQYAPDVNDGVRVNIAPLQKAGILARDVLAAKDVDKAIADRAEWRADERRWCRQGVLPQPGWWPEVRISATDAQDTVSSTAGI